MIQTPTRRGFLAALTAGVAGSALAPDARAVELKSPLGVHLDGDYLRVSAPGLNFLSGKTLDRLRDGASVAFLGQLTLAFNSNFMVAETRSIARFAVSYDIWEEKFSVTRFGDRAEVRRTVSHLSAGAAENWCIDNLTVDRGHVPADKPFYVQLDLRVEDPRDASGVIGDPGINITRLIEIFSRPPRGAQPRWLLNSGPVLASGQRLEIRG